MRKYRGKRKDKPDEWAYGWYMEHPFSDDSSKALSVIVQDEVPYEVIPETVGQSTGKITKNDVKIWEGDVLKCQLREPRWDSVNKVETSEIIGIAACWGSLDLLVAHPKAAANLHEARRDALLPNDYYNQHRIKETWNGKVDAEILGNAWDNPELLKATE